MKMFLGLLLVLISFNVRAEDKCTETAVRAAKENAVRASVVQSVQVIPAAKPYLEDYSVILGTSQDSNYFESIEVILMKSDCSVVSAIPQT